MEFSFLGFLFADDLDGVGTVAVVLGAVVSPICVLIGAYLAYRVNKQKNAFEKERLALERDQDKLGRRCSELQDEVNELEEQISQFKMELTALKVNEKNLIARLALVEDQRDEAREKYTKCLERCHELETQVLTLTKQELQLRGGQDVDSKH